MAEAPTSSSYHEDDSLPVQPAPGFEGVEKVLEIDFDPTVGPAKGLRLLTRAQLDVLCSDARCTIMASMSNDHLDSYVLSESSLFVYSHKIILKTCGTTTLLRCLESLLKFTKELGMRLEWVSYTRKDFQFPWVQKFPHRDPQEEITYLKRFFPEGSAFIAGPLTGDHWFVFVADYVDRATHECEDVTLDMMMFGIDEEVAKIFVKDTARFPKDSDVTKASGIDTLLPGSQIQEFCFDPCGYSMNGLLYDSYWTIHITPESHCSYASFETNIRLKSYNQLMRAVLAIFRPRKWTCTLFADENGVRKMKEMPFPTVLPIPLVASTSSAIAGPCVVEGSGSEAGTPHADSGSASPSKSGMGSRTPSFVDLASGAAVAQARGTMSFALTTKCQTEFLGDYLCVMGNYRQVQNREGVPPAKAVADVGMAISETLQVPRAKYVLGGPQLVEAVQQRMRGESM